MQIAAYKKKLRSQLVKQRKLLSLEEWEQKSNHICENLTNLSVYKKAQTILAYFCYLKEPNLQFLFSTEELKKWGFPRCENNQLIWHLWQPEDKLIKNIYGINEPLADSTLINPVEVDLILVPAIACDVDGFRLGYGGGYYDRLLNLPQWQNIPTIGIVFDFAYLPKLPREKWDQKLTYICTESQVYDNSKLPITDD